MSKLVIDAIKVQQNDYIYFLFKIRACDLLKIARFNPRTEDKISGVQRKFDVLRSKEIAEYIDSKDSVLANNIIVSFDSKSVKYRGGELQIEERPRIAFIIDGQHRLRAFEFAENKELELPVSGFIDLSLSEIAEIFVKINYYQKPVSKSLVYDLLGISKDIFPEFFEAHEVTSYLNETIGSPLFGSIRMLGIGPGVVTQAGLITALDKNKILNNVLSDFSTEQKAQILSNYFEAVINVLGKYWGKRGSIISKTVGINALLKIFPKIFKHIYRKTDGFTVEDIENKMGKLENIDFNSDEIASLGGMKGVRRLAEIMEKEIN